MHAFGILWIRWKGCLSQHKKFIQQFCKHKKGYHMIFIVLGPTYFQFWRLFSIFIMFMSFEHYLWETFFFILNPKYGILKYILKIQFIFDGNLTNTFGWTSVPNSFIRAMSGRSCSSFHSMSFYTSILHGGWWGSIYDTKDRLLGISTHSRI